MGGPNMSGVRKQTVMCPCLSVCPKANMSSVSNWQLCCPFFG